MKTLEKINEAVKNIVPDSDVFLFGSRARGDNKDDSDWDILILLPDGTDYVFRRMILNELLEIELAERQMFNVIFKNQNNWLSDDLTHRTPFYRTVNSELIRI